jgi:hypothetical protein
MRDLRVADAINLIAMRAEFIAYKVLNGILAGV